MTTLLIDQLLTTFASDSRPDVEYEVRLRCGYTSDEQPSRQVRFLSCNCPAWTRASVNSGKADYERSCKHTNRAALRFGQLPAFLKGTDNTFYGGSELANQSFTMPPITPPGQSYIEQTQARAAEVTRLAEVEAQKVLRSLTVEPAIAGNVKIVTLKSNDPSAREAVVKYTTGGGPNAARWLTFNCRECGEGLPFFAPSDRSRTCPKCGTVNYYPTLAFVKILAQVAPLARDDAGQVYWLRCRRCGALLAEFPKASKTGQCRICAGEIDYEGAGRSQPERLYPTTLPGATLQGRGMIVLTFGEAQQLLEFEPARLPLEPEIVLDDFFKGVRGGGGATGTQHEAYTDDEANRIRGIQPRGENDD